MRGFCLSLLLVVASGLAAPSHAQTIWARPYQPNQIALETVVPDLSDADVSLATGAAFLTATRSLSENLELATELPVARYATDAVTATAVGNPYVGLGLSSTNRPLLLELGVRIPAVPTNAAVRAGTQADLGRTAAFRDENISTSALLNGRLPLGRRASLRLRTGLTFASVDGATPNGLERCWELPYSAQLWWDGQRFMTGLSVEGRPLLNGSRPDKTTHHAVVSVMLDNTRLQPGIMVGTGLDPLFVDGRFEAIAGLTMSVSYGP